MKAALLGVVEVLVVEFRMSKVEEEDRSDNRRERAYLGDWR